ncbi:MAG: DUF3179 domain-containing protein [SAR202 cluster bacterium]|nr:DUF3179 domain-containing protein [SAR202 cluster bacterium]
MPNLNVLGLLTGAVALVAIACGGDATTPFDAEAAASAFIGTSPAPAGTVSPTTTVVRRIFIEGIEPTGLVEPDPEFKSALSDSSISTGPWKTDFQYHTVPFTDIISGGPPRDGIPPLDNPRFVTIEQADEWLSDLEPVISFEINGDQRAYPLQILMWHEVVNDEVGGVPVAVTFCPLCNSAIVFERTVNDLVLDFGTSGSLRNSDLVMWDRQTESWWQQLTGEAIIGVMAGTKLNFLAAPIISWQDYMTHQPDGTVLSKDTGYSRSYGQNPYVGYDRIDNPPFLFQGDLDGRLEPKERVAAITVDGVDAAFPFSTLAEEGAVNYAVNGVDVAVFFKSGTQSALDRSSIGSSRDVGSAVVFNADLAGQMLTFIPTDGGFTDRETGSTWNILGEAIDGPLAGERLTKIAHGDHFWFAWGAFKPDTLIYQGKS